MDMTLSQCITNYYRYHFHLMMDKQLKLMENKSYYPLRVGRFPNCIVTDTPTSFNGQPPDVKDVQYYGGYLVAESVPVEIARQLVEAYNEKYAPQRSFIHGETKIVGDMITHEDGSVEKRMLKHPLIVVFNEPYSSRYKIIQASDLLDDINDSSELAAMRAMDKLNLLLEKEGIIVVLKKKPNGAKGHLGNELLKKSDACINLENSDHSFTEGFDPHAKETDVPGESQVIKSISIDEQITWLDKYYKFSIKAGGRAQREDSRIEKMILAIKENLTSLKRWREGPVMKDIDCEKVIEDLLHIIKYPERAVQGLSEANNNIIQNAEAALGMLQALKEKRDTIKPKDYTIVARPLGHIGSELTKKSPTSAEFEAPLKDGRPEKLPIDKDVLKRQLHQMLMKSNNDKGYCDAIIFAIEQMKILDEKRYLIPAEKHQQLVNDIVAKLPFYPEVNQTISSVMVYAIEQYLTYLNQPPDGKS